MSSNSRGVLSEVMTAMKKVVPPRPFRLFLRVMNFAVKRILNSNGDGIAGRHSFLTLNSHEMNFCAVDKETDLTRQLIYLLGYAVIDPAMPLIGQSEDIVLLDVDFNKPTLQAFCELAEQELVHTCPGVDELHLYSDVTVLVAHLAYNFRLRLEILVLLTPVEMFSVIEEEVTISVGCIDYLMRRLDILQTATSSSSPWNVAKETVWSHVVSRGSDVSHSTVKSLLEDIGKQIYFELSIKFAASVACIFKYAHSIGLVSSMVASGHVMQGYFSGYLDNVMEVPRDFFTERYTRSVDDLQALMLQSTESQLSLDEMERIFEVTVWQSRYFIYHIRSTAAEVYDWDIGQMSQCVLCQQTDSGESSDGIEKVDESEKKEKTEDTDDDICRELQHMPGFVVQNLLYDILKSAVQQVHLLALLLGQVVEFTDQNDLVESAIEK